MNGRFSVVSTVLESSIFAFSAASRSRCIAWRSPERSTPCSRLNSVTSHWIKLLSMSIPPSCVSPDVEMTSKTPSPISIRVTSTVPPPTSRTAFFPPPFLSLRRSCHEDPALRDAAHGREHLPAVRAAFRARDNLGRSPFHVACLRVRGSEVDSDDLSHWYHLDFSRR